MTKPTPEHTPPTPSNPGASRRRSVLLVGEARSAQGLLDAAAELPTISTDTCNDWFDALVAVSRQSYDAVLAPVRDIERRPEAAVRQLRALAGDARLILLAEPALEVLSRRLTSPTSPAACDDYVIWPATTKELTEVLFPPANAPLLPPPPPTPARPEVALRVESFAARVAAIEARSTSPQSTPAPPAPYLNGNHASPPAAAPILPPIATPPAGLPVAEIALDALLTDPCNALATALARLNERLPLGGKLSLLKPADAEPLPNAYSTTASRPLPAAAAGVVLHLLLTQPRADATANTLLDTLVPHLTRLAELQDRHTKLQKLAITDDLTGLCNARYFRHYLDRILVRAREGRFPVTLLMFDIDHFKRYNDQFGHAAGDEILRQTGHMMKRCVREHDIVARLGGDEFAVIFWEKDGPRAPIAGKPTPAPTGRPPKTPEVMFQRFKRMIAHHDFGALGPDARGELTISGGLAVYPYDAQTADDLIKAADGALMFGAKKSGRNTLAIVGPENKSPA